MPADVMVSAADLAVTYAVPIGTIYRWASEDRWARTRYSRPVRYSLADADATYRKHYPAQLTR